MSIPPQDLEAERCLLGCLLLDKNAIVKVVDFLQDKDFYKEIHRQIYISVAELFEKGEPVDLLAVSSRLREKKLLESMGGAGYLTELINSVPTSSHILNYAKIVQRKRILRELIDASQEINTLGHEEQEDIDELLDKAEQRIFSISQRSLSQRFLPIKDSLEQAFERIDMLSKHEGNLRGVSTGFKDLDNILAGFQKSDLIILAARPSIGKSALAVNFAANIAINNKLPVGIFSLEMSNDQIIDRLIASIANIDLWKLRTGKLSSEGENNDFERIQHAMGILSSTPIFIDDAASSNVLQMRAMARRLQAEHGLGLLVIDYLQLVEPRNSNASPVQQVSEISRSLKGLARELNIPVLALSQLSRAVEHRVPQIPKLADLRESGCLTGDTLITRADTGERTPIKNLVGKANIPIHALDENLKIKTHFISKVFSSGQKMVYELKTKSGFKIKASANHPFKKLDGWHQLNNLRPGDHIATPRQIKISTPLKMDDNEIILLAHLLGDGCVLPKQPIHYTSADHENIKIVKNAAKTLFRINSRIVKQENWWHVYLPSPYRLARGKHHPIINWFNELKIHPVRSYEKEIPEKIFSLSEQQTALFLKHLWATDGNISIKKLLGRKDSGNIYYATTSDKLAEGVKYLLLRLGIRSKIGGVKKENYRICYHVSIQGKEEQLKFLNLVGCYGKRGKLIPKLIRNIEKIKSNTNIDIIPKEVWHKIGKFKELFNLSWRRWAQQYQMAYCGSALFKHGVSRERIGKIISFMPSQELKDLSDSDIFWDEIESIIPLQVEEVYDATVPGVHNFLPNGIVAHNSLEQDADVVLFIYREDRYNPETSRKNIADLMIAKHRNGPVGKVGLYFNDQTVSFKNLEKQQEYQE